MNKKFRDMNKNRDEAYQIFIFFRATKDYNTLTGMGTIASTCLYNTAKTASNFWTLSDITGYQVVPKKKSFFECLPTIFLSKKKKRQYSIYCFYGASRREQGVKRILIGTTHKSLYKNENRNTHTFHTHSHTRKKTVLLRVSLMLCLKLKNCKK